MVDYFNGGNDDANAKALSAVIADDAQADLEKAMHGLKGAMQALELLNKADVAELKMYQKPPKAVEKTIEAVMVLRKSEPTWAEGKKQLGDPNFLVQLVNYDKDSLDDAVLNKISKWTKDPEFDPEVVGAVSKAAKSLCMWVRAMEVYGRNAKQVASKPANLQAAMKTLSQKQAQLASVVAGSTASLAHVRERLARDVWLTPQLAFYNDADESVKAAQQAVASGLDAAQELVTGLGGAEDALKAITGKDIQMLKVLKKPPELFVRIFDAVLILFQKSLVPCAAVEVNIKKQVTTQLEGSWQHASSMMADPRFLTWLQRFNKEAINDETVELLYPYLAAPDFTADDAAKVSGSLAGLCSWCLGMARYADVKNRQMQAGKAGGLVAEGAIARAVHHLGVRRNERLKSEDAQLHLAKLRSTIALKKEIAEHTQRALGHAMERAQAATALVERATVRYEGMKALIQTHQQLGGLLEQCVAARVHCEQLKNQLADVVVLEAKQKAALRGTSVEAQRAVRILDELRDERGAVHKQASAEKHANELEMRLAGVMEPLSLLQAERARLEAALALAQPQADVLSVELAQARPVWLSVTLHCPLLECA
jgi:hypothetical protein